MLNEGHEILAAEGVLADDAASIIRDFAIQRYGRPEIKKPVGHIPISFSTEDLPRLTNEFLLQLAEEYKQEMGIVNTQYVIVRHHDTEHPHIHIVYNRIDNDLKVISVNNDYKRNVKACKKIKDKHNLTYGTGKEKVNRPKLTGADKVKYQIHDEIAANLPKCNNYKELENRLRQAGVTILYKYRSGAKEAPENIQGVSFEKDGVAFKGSEIDRKFSHANIKKALDKNMDELMAYILDIPNPRKVEPETIAPATQTQVPKGVIRPEPECKMQEMPPVTEQKSPEIPHPAVNTTTPEQPHSAKRYPSISGVELSAEQWKTLQDGGHIYLENMNKKDASGKFSAYVFMDDERKIAFRSRENPDIFVKYGKYEMRLRDKILIEKGHLTKATVKWWGAGNFAHPYLWRTEKDKPGEYQESWGDPRIPQSTPQKQREEEQKHRQKRVITPPKKNNGPKRG